VAGSGSCQFLSTHIRCLERPPRSHGSNQHQRKRKKTPRPKRERCKEKRYMKIKLTAPHYVNDQEKPCGNTIPQVLGFVKKDRLQPRAVFAG